MNIFQWHCCCCFAACQKTHQLNWLVQLWSIAFSVPLISRSSNVCRLNAFATDIKWNFMNVHRTKTIHVEIIAAIRTTIYLRFIFVFLLLLLFSSSSSLLIQWDQIDTYLCEMKTNSCFRNEQKIKHPTNRCCQQIERKTSERRMGRRRMQKHCVSFPCWVMLAHERMDEHEKRAHYKACHTMDQHLNV